MRSMVDGQGRCFSAYAHLLPYLDAAPLYARIHFEADPDNAAINSTALGQTIPFFLCPSDSFRILQSNMISGVIIDSAVHNYPLNTGTTYPVSPRNPAGTSVTGVFFENSSVRFADLTDGSTAGSDNATNGPELTDYKSQCQGAGLPLQQTRGSRWLYGAPGHSMYNHIRPPNHSEVDCRGGIPHSIRTNDWWDRLSHDVAARSRHIGGVHALFCDGHVQFVGNSIASEIWKALGSRGGGEALGDY